MPKQKRSDGVPGAEKLVACGPFRDSANPRRKISVADSLKSKCDSVDDGMMR